MSTTATRRWSLIALASATAGVASVAALPTAANAQETDPQPDTQSSSETVFKGTEPAPEPASHGTCFSWTTVPAVSNPGGVRVNINVPTTARDNNQRHCILVRGNNTEGVFKLQDAINKCYPQFSAGVGFDGNYGSNTQRAVSQIQSVSGVDPDGVYGPDTKTAMRWPSYRQSNGAFFACGLLRA